MVGTIDYNMIPISDNDKEAYDISAAAIINLTGGKELHTNIRTNKDIWICTGDLCGIMATPDYDDFMAYLVSIYPSYMNIGMEMPRFNPSGSRDMCRYINMNDLHYWASKHEWQATYKAAEYNNLHEQLERLRVKF